MPRPSRKERERMARIRAILGEAARVFAEKGYRGARMRDIARRAEFAVGTLYALFPGGKKQIFESLADRIAEQFVDWFRARTRSVPGARERIEAFMDAYLAFFEDHAPLLRIYIAQMRNAPLGLPVRLRGRALQIREQVIRRLATLFRSGIKSGAFRRADPVLLAESLDALLERFVLCHMAEGDRSRPGQRYGELKALFFQGVAARASAPRQSRRGRSHRSGGRAR